MTKINRARLGGGDDDFAGFGEEPTFPARYAGTCATCSRRFAEGDPIAPTVVDKKTVYHHGACRYPASAFLAQASGDDAGVAAGASRSTSATGKCKATTKKGKPCSNTPQKGEQFCGPHLTQHLAR